MVHFTHVLKQPIVTEKTVAQKDKYVFHVAKEASKQEVKKALEEFYGITVEKINIINLPEKTRMARRGVESRKRAPFKKAIVTVKKGETIDFNTFK